MKPEEQRIAIAEACGWKHHKGEEPTYGGTFKQAGWMSPANRFNRSDWTSKTANGLPDYLNDLNAMHEAEKLFDDKSIDTKSLYWDYLALIAMPEPFPGDDTFLRDYVMIRATAAQRAEAFLRTIGKWKD